MFGNKWIMGGTVPFEQWCFSHYGPVLFTATPASVWKENSFMSRACALKSLQAGSYPSFNTSHLQNHYQVTSFLRIWGSNSRNCRLH